MNLRLGTIEDTVIAVRKAGVERLARVPVGRAGRRP